MAITPIRIPKLAMTITEATPMEPCVEDGARVEEGKPLFLLATDKAENEIESPATGTVRWSVEWDRTYEIGTQIGVIETDE